MKVVIVGSTQYEKRFSEHKQALWEQGHMVKTPAFDHFPGLDALGVCEYNRELIEWADEVHMIWDGRSIGTIFDFGMAFALHKPVKIVYLEPKKFEDVVRGYAQLFE